MDKGTATLVVVITGHEVSTNDTLRRSICTCCIGMSWFNRDLAHVIYRPHENEKGHPEVEFTQKASLHTLSVSKVAINSHSQDDIAVQTVFESNVNIFTGWIDGWSMASSTRCLLPTRTEVRRIVSNAVKRLARHWEYFRFVDHVIVNIALMTCLVIRRKWCLDI